MTDARDYLHGSKIEHPERIERHQRFTVTPFVIADGRTAQQIERDQRLLRDVRRLAQERLHADDVDPRDRVFGKPFVVQRAPLRTQAQAMQGTPGLDYLPSEACTRCGAVPWWDGFRFELTCDPVAHGALSEAQRLDRAIERANGSKPLERIAVPMRVLSDDDE